ncbi:hypothetical protein [Nocardioides sp.]|uniref:hypothetical protein n=1 Tax=Nocardioides sp. TaxID=35761 RepID=UPI0039C98CBB
MVGKGDKLAVLPLPPAVARAVERASQGRTTGRSCGIGPGARMSRHSTTRRLRNLATSAGVPMTRMHPHVLRHTYVTHARRRRAPRRPDSSPRC